jgi:LysM repeat protein
MKRNLTFLLFLLGVGAGAQGTPTEVYIEKWYKVAIAEMKTYGIPASITLAQGILESGSGQSYLAEKANNHFGIKCHLDWTGKKVYYDDDEESECFRRYKKPQESYRDHSLFLKNRSRYAFLFEEDPTDYKAWAKGLSKAGYATDRRYAKRLIELIETHQLHNFDLPNFSNEPEEQVYTTDEEELVKVSDNHIEYVIAEPGATFESIAIKTGKKVPELLEYNELRYDASLKEGAIIYLQPKRKKAAFGVKIHVVAKGDKMYDISQRYGIRLEELYQRNGMYVGDTPRVGQKLELR